MATAESGSWLAIGRCGGAIATVLVLLIAGVGAGHLALSNMQGLLGGFAVGPGNENVRDGSHDRFERHAARGWEWRHAARNNADFGAAAADARHRGFAARRECRDRRACVKAADAGPPKAYE